MRPVALLAALTLSSACSGGPSAADDQGSGSDTSASSSDATGAAAKGGDWVLIAPGT